MFLIHKEQCSKYKFYKFLFHFLHSEDIYFYTELFSTETEPGLATWDCSGAVVTRWKRQGAGEVCVNSVSSFETKTLTEINDLCME